MQRLSGVDAAFLYMETPAQHMHALGVTVVDPSTIPGGYDFEATRASFVQRLLALPAFRRRLIEFPFRLDHPAWIDARVELAPHVVRAALDPPGTPAQFEEFVGRYASQQLRRDRPLWEFCIVEGLEGGRLAILAKIHHCIVDGVSGAQMLQDIFDLEPVAPERGLYPEGFGEDEAAPSLFDLAAASLQARVGDPVRAVTVVTDTLVSAAEAIVALSGDQSVTLPLAAPWTPFSHSLTSRRAVSFARASLADVKAIKNAFENMTVNDVALSICGGALHHYLEARGDLPAESLIAMAPISTRTESERASAGNQVSAMSVALHTEIADAKERLLAVNSDTRRAKELTNAIGARTLTDYTQFVPSTVTGLAARLASRAGLANRFGPIFNTVVTNVPGPQVPLYMLGAQLVGNYGYLPLMDSVGLGHVIQSYCGAFTISITADRQMMPDPAFYAECLTRAFEELRAATAGATKPRAKKAPKAAPRKLRSARAGTPRKRKAAPRKATAAAAARGRRGSRARATR